LFRKDSPDLRGLIQGGFMKFEKVRKRIAQWWILAFVAGMGLLMLNCAIPNFDDIGMPSWDIPFALPFGTETYGLNDLIVDSLEFDSTGNGILEGPNGSLQFVLEDSIPKMTLEEDQFSFDPGVEQEFIVGTDTLILDNLSEPRDENLLIDEIFDLDPDAYDDGDLVQYIAFTLPEAEHHIQFQGLDSMEYVHIMENGGGLNLTVTNNTTVQWDSILVEIQRADIDDDQTFITIGSLSFYDISTGDAEEKFMDLSSQILTSVVKLVINGGGPGNIDPGTVFNHADGLNFQLVVQTLKCDEASAIIPGQAPKDNEDALELSSEDWINTANISYGSLHFEVENQTDVNSRITISFPDIYDESDEIWSTSFILERNDTGEPEREIRDVELAGYQLRLELPLNEGDPQYLRAVTEVEIVGTGTNGGTYSRIALGDSVITSFETTELILSRFSGVPKAINMEVDQQTIDIDIFESQPDLQTDLLNKMSLANVHIEAELNNAFDLPVRLILSFEATNSVAGESYTLIDTVTLDPLQGEIDDITGFEEILNILPDQLLFSASVQTGRDYFPFDGSTFYNIATTDSLEGIFRLVAPFSLEFSDTTTINPEPQSMVPLEQNDIQQAQLAVDITNDIPVGGRIYMLVWTSEDIESTEEDLMEEAKRELVIENAHLYNFFDPITLPVPELGSDGMAVSPIDTTIVITLEKEKFDLFAEKVIYTKQILQMFPTIDQNGDTLDIVMTNEDFLSVGMIAEITYRVNAADSTGGDQ
jgi:hypothetical protein